MKKGYFEPFIFQKLFEPLKSTYLMDEPEHGHCYFERKDMEMEMGKLKYRTHKLFFHDYGTYAAVPWMEKES